MLRVDFLRRKMKLKGLRKGSRKLREMEELKKKKEIMALEVSVDTEVSKITGLKDASNVASVIGAAKGSSTQDNFLNIAKLSDYAQKQGIRVDDDIVLNAKVVQEAEDLGFQIPLLKRFVENMKSEGFDFSNLLNEIRASMMDKRSYERTVQELSVRIKKLGEEKEKAEREIDERSDIISKMDDDTKQKNESIKSRNSDLKILNENISKNKDELTGLEQ